MRALIYDVGQCEPALLGAMLLSSSPYTLRDRDSYLGWLGAEKERIKQSGLRRILDLALCMPLPPYSYLLGGKLVAALAFTEVVRSEFRNRYRDELLCLVTTSVTGLHCPLFNRIAVRTGGLYRRIGQTSGYSTTAVSSRTLRAARRFLPSYQSPPEGEFSVSVRPIHILRTALRRCGISRDTVLRTSNPKGIYIALGSDADLAALRSGSKSKSRHSLTLDEAMAFWREKVLPKARSHPLRQATFYQFQPEDIALSKVLERTSPLRLNSTTHRT
jgi:hypothetical protein